MSKVLVTGATGTTGRQVVQALRNKGVDVRAGVRNVDKAKDLSKLGAEVVRFDFDDAISVTSALEGVERVFLLSAFTEDPLPTVRDFVAKAKDAGVKHIVRMSAAGADPNSESLLPQKHGQGEEIVKSSGIAWSVVRPTFFMDNVLNFHGATIAKDGAFYGASGGQKVAYLSTADLAEAVAVILAEPSSHEGKTYELTGGHPVTDEEVAETLGELLGKPVKYVDLEPEQIGAGARSNGVPAWMADALAGLEQVKRNGWAQTVSPDLEALIGRSPETFEAFLKRNKARLLSS